MPRGIHPLLHHDDRKSRIGQRLESRYSGLNAISQRTANRMRTGWNAKLGLPHPWSIGSGDTLLHPLVVARNDLLRQRVAVIVGVAADAVEVVADAHHRLRVKIIH
ncbi:MAG: hypothetical protein JWQ62_2831 [Lacunisphaera sp.]|nr:hypothetical protein [Lacunisphaera sp.]